MEIIKKDLSNGNFTKELFEKLDAKLSFGIVAVTKRTNIIIFETKKIIKITIQIQNKTTYKILNPNNRLIKTLIKAGGEKPAERVYIYDRNQEMCYSESKGLISKSEAGNTDYFYEYAGEDTLKVAYEKREKLLREIGNKFEMNLADSHLIEFELAKRLAWTQLKYFEEVEHVEEEEGDQLEGSTRGALQYAKKGVIADCFDYDINSLYPHIMANTDFHFPMLEPVGHNIKTKSKPGDLEIFQLKIKGQHKYWKDTPDNYYNTYHIEILKLLNIEYEFASERKTVYVQPLKSSDAFGYMNDLYEMKKNGNSCAKAVMNITHGILSRRKDYEVPIENLKEYDMDNVLQIRTDKGYAIMRSRSRPYKHCFARLKSFLLTYARLFMIRDVLLPLESKGFEVFQVNTDGFITNAKPDQMEKIYPISKQMGDLKVEKEFKGFHEITHVRLIEKLDEVF